MMRLGAILGISSPPPSLPSVARSFPLTLPAALFTLVIAAPNAPPPLPSLLGVGRWGVFDGFSLGVDEVEACAECPILLTSPALALLSHFEAPLGLDEEDMAS